ncbi:MAG: hypothetical protein U9R03_00040, partial [Candidatus Aerophobetes bacterium]|nr:hypothetical protein [Candidatus Aerophobetes bacterium]
MKKLIIKGLVLPRQTLLFYTDPELGWQDGGTPFIVTEEGDYVIEVDRQERDSFKCYVLHP